MIPAPQACRRSAWSDRLEYAVKIARMTRSELTTVLAERFPQLTRKDSDLAVAVILEAAYSALVLGNRIEIRGFGSFGLNDRPARQARNPKTGAPVTVQAKRVPAFKAGKELRERVMASASC